MSSDTEEMQFLQRVSPTFGGISCAIPKPQLGPLDRLRRRLAFRNQIHVYPRRSMVSQQSVMSMFYPGNAFGIITNEEFFNDAIDAMQWGSDFDAAKPLFAQVAALRDQVPHMARSALFNENCDFASNLSYCKNCYLIFNSTHVEDSMYGENLWQTKDSLDSSYLTDCELCYDCLLCQKCYNLQSSWDCEGCSESYFLLGCISCQHCFGCVNLRHKEHYIYNRAVTAAEYTTFLSTINLASRTERAVYAEQAEKLWRSQPRPHVTVKHCENVEGNYLFHSRDLKNCFFINNGESLQHCAFLYGGAKDCRDLTFVGLNSELMYESAWCALNCRLCRFCFWCLQCDDLLYCWHCISCRNCFGCVGLRNKEFCVLNRQYTKEEYARLVPRIIEQMSNSGTWGEFFPMSMSPIPYNHSMAQRYFPLTEKEVRDFGCTWYEKPAQTVAGAISTESLPDIDALSDETLIFKSAQSGAPFRITSEERKRYRKFCAPLPTLTYDERLTARALRLGGLVLHRRRCEKTGESLVSNYTADSGWTIWSKEAYEASF